MTGSIDTGGATIAYEVIGEGEPVAFLNGVMMTMQSWVLQKPVFLPRYRCIFHDFRGQLLSPAPEAEFTMEDQAGDLLRLLDHLQVDRCHLVGTSYGGEVGLIFALRHPSRVKSLSAIGCVGEVSPELDRRVEAWAERAATEPDTLYRSTLHDNFSEGFLKNNGWILEQGEERLRRYPRKYFDDLARLVNAFRRLDILQELRALRVPALIMCGEKDALKPLSASRDLAAAIPDCEFLTVPGAGHAVVIERASEINTAVLGWIEKNRWN